MEPITITIDNLKDLKPYINELGYKFYIYTKDGMKELPYISAYQICLPETTTFDIVGIGFRKINGATKIVITRKDK